MSLHVSPSNPGFSSRMPAGEIISPDLIDGVPPRPEPVRELTGPAEDGLSIRLDTIGMVVSISAAASAQARSAAPLAIADEVKEEVRVRFERSDGQRGTRAEAGSAGSADQDPVVRRLSRALAALGGYRGSPAGEFADVCADALRLAIVTRTLSLHSQPLPEFRPATPTARPARPGLPQWRLKRVAAYVDENIAETITLAGMAAAAGLSRMHFAAQFRLTTGIRPREYVMRRRIELAQRLLLESRESLVQIALSVGFQTQAHFTTVFRRFIGDTPHQWRSASRRAVRT